MSSQFPPPPPPRPGRLCLMEVLLAIHSVFLRPAWWLLYAVALVVIMATGTTPDPLMTCSTFSVDAMAVLILFIGGLLLWSRGQGARPVLIAGLAADILFRTLYLVLYLLLRTAHPMPADGDTVGMFIEYGVGLLGFANWCFEVGALIWLGSRSATSRTASVAVIPSKRIATTTQTTSATVTTSPTGERRSSLANAAVLIAMIIVGLATFGAIGLSPQLQAFLIELVHVLR